MYFKQFYLGCLAQASYLIGSDNEAVVVDPQRDVDEYLEEAKANGLEIKYIIETHLHADFVSGHKELADRTGAEIIFGARAGAGFEHIAASDGAKFQVGKVKLEIMETPGHTPESICILVTDTEESDSPKLILTGDTLFIGDVGRPDLVGSKGFSSQEMAGMLYDSLHEKILTLDDSVMVYPAHGAGSLCGKNMSEERSSTLGQQRKFNYALKPMEREEFISIVACDQPEVPAYFPVDVELNRRGASSLGELPTPRAMSAQEVRKAREDGAQLLDVRPRDEYLSRHAKGSLNIGLDGQYASWAGTLIRMETPLILIAGKNDDVEVAVMRLARIGIESVVGFLEGGVDAWEEEGFEMASISNLSPEELDSKRKKGDDLAFVDVRRTREFSDCHATGAINIPLSELRERVAEIPRGKPIAIICRSGYRSAIGASILEESGFGPLMNVEGGTNAWRSAHLDVVEASEATSPSCSDKPA